MEVLLVNPAYLNKVYSAITKAVLVQVPLGLAYIAGILEKNAIKVNVLDANAEMLSIDETVDRILKDPFLFVGITAHTSTITTVYNIARKVKKNSDKIIIVGGVHATVLPGETLKECSAIDIIVMGEGEETVLELMQKGGRNLSQIKGIAFRDKEGKIIINERRPRISNLDMLPLPARHLFPLNLYRPGAAFNIGIKRSRFATLIASRGCPGRCKFCASFHYWGPKVVLRSAENIVREIEHLIENYNIEQLGIFDDTFFASLFRVERFCDLIIQKNIKIKWWCYTRPDRIYSDKLLKKIKSAGCYALNVGLESGNQNILRRANKDISIDVMKKFIKIVKREDFMLLVCFIIGLPGDNRRTVMQTIRIARELNPHIVEFCIATPFPGTELYKEALKKEWLREVKNWDDIGLHMRTKFRNDNLSSKEIYELHNIANRKFYFRIKYFWQLLIRLIRHPNELKGFFYGGLYIISENIFNKEVSKN